MRIVDWPIEVLKPRDMKLWLHSQTLSANRSLSGFVQVGSAATQRWRLEMDLPPMKPDKLKALNAILWALRGRENVLRVPISKHYFLPSDAALSLSASIPHDGDVYFSDDLGYDDGDISDVYVTLAKGAVELTADLSAWSYPLEGGMMFGIEDDVYGAVSVVGNAVRFEPSARRDYAAGRLRLRPRLTCRLTQDESGAYALRPGKIGEASIELEEIVL
jgi:hypothetical protein